MKNKLLFLVPLFAVSACQQERFEEQICTMQHIAVNTGFDADKVSMNADHGKFVWTTDDAVTIFNNKGNLTTDITVSGSPVDTEVPEGTTVIYGLYPPAVCTEGPSNASVNIPAAQSQAEGGKFNGSIYPLGAAADVIEHSASLRMKPLAGILALNIYRTDGNPNGEKVKSIVITPKRNSHFAGAGTVDLTADTPAFTSGDSESGSISVTLTEEQTVAGSKPTSTQAYTGQIYAVLARGQYKEIQFEICTSEGKYTVTSSATYIFDLESNDILVQGLNLTNQKLYAVLGLGSEDVTESDITSGSNGSFENPVSYDANGEVNCDIIPDFSRMGYKYSDAAIPTLPVKKTITPASVSSALASGTYNDTTSYIQSVIDEVGNNGGGAILLKAGTYNTHGTLFIDYSNTVLRGEGTDNTVLMANGTVKRCAVFIGRSREADVSDADSMKFAGRKLGRSSLRAADQYNKFGDTYVVQFNPAARNVSYGESTQITEEYVPVGRLYIEVGNPDLFSPGDNIAIYRPYNDNWISDIGMDKIAKNGREGINSGTKQWNTIPSSFERYWTRKVVAVHGKRLYLDCPVVQSMDQAYGGGVVYKYTADRISGSGIENMTIKSSCRKDISDPDSYYKGYWIDEAHAWEAVMTKMAEHCWIRNIDSYCFGYALAALNSGTRNVTVENCHSYDPVSIVNGGRRYAFDLSGAELCLIKDCTCELDRHGFVTNTSRGPNVFLRCTASNYSTSIGPHQHWGTGDLYDNVNAGTSGTMEAYDRGNAGTGHGWAGANYVYWNCTAKRMTCQSPWARENTPELETMPGGYKFHSSHPSARNYVIGFIGQRYERPASSYESPYSGFPSDGVEDYYVKLGFNGTSKLVRPEAQWYPFISPGASGSKKVSLPDTAAAAANDWWPRFTLTVFSNPTSLFECQLEDRHYRGIYLNTL